MRAVMRGRLGWEWLFCTLAVMVAALLLQQGGTLQRLDLAVYDTVLRLDAAPAHADIVIVAIDETSVQALGYWPWPRERHAELLRRLAAAAPRAVAMDVLFTEPVAPTGVDDALARALAELREVAPVFLPMTLRDPLTPGREPQPLLPLPSLTAAVTALGHIHVELDSDSVVRGLYLREGAGAWRWDALGMLLAGAAGARAPPPGPDAPPDGSGWRRESRLLLPFAGAAGAYRTVPYVSVWRGEVPEAVLRDKIVLVGLTATGVGDYYPTPLSGVRALTPGVEINATVVDGLLGGRMLRPVGPWGQAIGAVLALLAWMAWLWRLGPQGGFWGVCGFLLAALATSAATQVWLRWWLPVLPWAAAALLGYLLWSWRRLAALLADLYGRAEALHPGAMAQMGGPRDGWQHVVAALDRGLAAQQQAQRQRRDALQLLSHDLRAPQSAILALLHTAPATPGQQEAWQGRIEQQVRATLALADDFMVQLHAEGEAYDWQEVDLAPLAIEVHDRAWPLAHAKAIDLALELPQAPEGCWMTVEPRLLGRALFNLVENAIKYSPEGSRVVLSLVWTTGREAVFFVRDPGEGVAPEDLPRLFDRYTRFGNTERVGGHGLGLSLVKVVAERHGGRVHCESVPGRGCTFTLALPAWRALD